MSDRPSRHSSRKTQRHIVAKGTPSYRAVRSPLLTSRPSLADADRRGREMRRNGMGVATALVIAACVVWIVVQIGHEVITDSASAPTAVRNAPVPPVGPPEPLALAKVPSDGISEQSLTLRLPVRRVAITAIGYDRRGDSQLLVLEPEGGRANVRSGSRLLDRFFATEQSSGLRWYHLSDDSEYNLVSVGAAPGTDVYAPISGRVIAIAEWIVNGEQLGVIVQLQPLGDAETVVSMRGIDAAEELAVGQTVAESVTLIGTVRDLGEDAQTPLSKYTHDAGTGVELSVRQVQPEAEF